MARVVSKTATGLTTVSVTAGTGAQSAATVARERQCRMVSLSSASRQSGKSQETTWGYLFDLAFQVPAKVGYFEPV